MGLRKLFQSEVISPSSRAGVMFRFSFEVVGLLVFLVGVVIFVPGTFAAIILMCLGAIILIRKKAYSEFGLIQGRPAIFIGSTFLTIGGVLTVYAILKA